MELRKSEIDFSDWLDSAFGLELYAGFMCDKYVNLALPFVRTAWRGKAGCSNITFQCPELGDVGMLEDLCPVAAFVAPR